MIAFASRGAIWKLLIGTLAAQVAAPAQPEPEHKCKEYFVSPSGSDTNAGTEASPWLSIGTALSNIFAGDTVTVLPGVYAEAVVIEVSGSREFPTVVRSKQKWEATIKGSTSHGIYTADGVTNVIIDGLQIVGAKIDGIKVGSHVTVRNCWVHGSGGQGISAHKTYGTTLEYNLIEHNGTDASFDHGIYVSGTNDVIRGNVIRWNKTYGCQIYYDPPASSANCQFYNNLVYGNRNALTVWSPTGQTNYVFNNTLLASNLVVVADYGTLCVSNNIMLGPKRGRPVSAEDGARLRADFNLVSALFQRGSHDLVATDPAFLNPDAGLFWLRGESPARGTAAPRMVAPVDFFGQAQSKAYDVGAFQFRARFARDSRCLDPSPAKPDYWSTNLSACP